MTSPSSAFAPAAPGTPPPQGESNLLEALAKRYSQSTGRTITSSQVAFAPGTQSAISFAMMALVEAGDDVLIPDPYYATYEGVVATTGANVVPVPLSPDRGFHLQADDLRAALTKRSRVLLLNTPSNPTGTVLTPDELVAIGEVCVEHDLTIVCDEVYADLTFDGAYTSPFAMSALADRTVVVSSVSKSHAMTGWRCGWMVASPEFIQATLPIIESLLFGSQQFLQDATEFAISRHFAECDAMRIAYATRARAVVDRLNGRGGLQCRMPEGGMFIMADVRAVSASGEAFAWRLLDEYGVVTMPGESFGSGGAGHLRISLTTDIPVLEAACDRIVALAENW